ncbi:MAG: cation-transporting P-type ATPase, partial [Anaerolineae bacterium]
MTAEAFAEKIEIPHRDWHALPVQDVLRHLEVHEQGLTSEEVARRLAHYGENQLSEGRRPGFWQLLWEQLNNFVVLLLLAAALVSALLGDTLEAAAIMAIVVLN